MQESARILVLLQGVYEEIGTWLSQEWERIRATGAKLPEFDELRRDTNLRAIYDDALVAVARDLIEYASFGNAEAEVDDKLRLFRDSLIKSVAEPEDS